MAAAEADAGGVARAAAGAGIGDGLGAAVREIDVELPIGRNQLDEIERDARRLARRYATDAAGGDGAAVDERLARQHDVEAEGAAREGQRPEVGHVIDHADDRGGSRVNRDPQDVPRRWQGPAFDGLNLDAAEREVVEPRRGIDGDVDGDRRGGDCADRGRDVDWGRAPSHLARRRGDGSRGVEPPAARTGQNERPARLEVVIAGFGDDDGAERCKSGRDAVLRQIGRHVGAARGRGRTARRSGRHRPEGEEHGRRGRNQKGLHWCCLLRSS